MYNRKTEKQRGRLETREYYYTEETEWKRSKRDRCINFNNRRKWEKSGTEKVLHNEYSRGVEEFVRAVRRHWAIESYHWILNMTFREDTSRTLDKNVARNLNILRKLAILILEELPFRKKFSRRIKRYIILLDVRRYLKLFFDI